ncbi:biotin/lipoyl-containing protein [Intrasporangium sp. YIM S08009]|uniref:biotin/lipoyl-containing protein n=1 Tax=Intrasporangium zincisolvens TaxID=3080018 RepID=UPI002B0600E1|nr:biotin/lipoyl-containing protein [Intrasporangium sp. YIM S08009]
MPRETLRRTPTARRLPAHVSGGAGAAGASRAADSTDRRVTAPFAGIVVPVVRVGDDVTPGQVVATIEAIKMEAAIMSPWAGTVARLVVAAHQPVEGGDVIAELR